ncbi:MAG: hypothetical protein L0332_13660 [Chloroflexi bacterium]|nr:hypothetical protein [Chloroflexota bacterium]MCI0727751.1 hypothetical protein [Chloroflexota bacterium]
MPVADRLIWSWLSEGVATLGSLLYKHAPTAEDREAVEKLFQLTVASTQADIGQPLAAEPIEPAVEVETTQSVTLHGEVETAAEQGDLTAELPASVHEERQPAAAGQPDAVAEPLITPQDESIKQADLTDEGTLLPAGPANGNRPAPSPRITPKPLRPKTKPVVRPAIPVVERKKAPPPTPPIARDTLKTLDEWESWLRWRIRSVELLGETDLTEKEYQQIGQLLRNRLKTITRDKADSLLEKQYPLVFATFLVASGVYDYQGGDYWNGVEQQTKANFYKRAHWGQLFERILAKFQLSNFPEMAGEGHPFVSVILAHGGIPDYSLSDFFANVLLPAVIRPQYSDLATPELLNALLERTDVQSFTDKPVRRFLEYGGKVAEDFFERSREMMLAYIETGTLSTASEVGLPQRVVERFARWAIEQETLDTKRQVRDRLRLRKPELILDPSGEGISLLLPAQEIPATLAQETFTWQITDKAHPQATKTIPSRLRRIGYDLLTEAYTVAVEEPLQELTVLFQIGSEEIREWSIVVRPSAAPLLAFDPQKGSLIPWRHSLPAERLWLLFPVQAEFIFDGEARCLEEFPELPGAWSVFQGGDWDLSQVQQIRLVEPGRAWTAIQVRPSERLSQPTLVGGTRFRYEPDRQDVPLYVGRPPGLRIPLTGRMSVREEISRWQITLENRWAAVPTIENPRFRLDEVGDATTVTEEAIFLDLAAPHLLGASPRGTFRLRARGPLGKDADYRFQIWPVVEVQGLDSLYMPTPSGPPTVSFQLILPTDDRVAPQVGVTGLNIEEEGVTAGSFHIEVAPDIVSADCVLLHETGSGEPVQLPVRLPIPRLRWALPEQAESLVVKEWTGQTLRRGVLELLQASAIPWFMLDLPYHGDATLHFGLRLSDSRSQLLQEGRVYPGHRQQRYWRLSLGEFLDTIRTSASPLLRLDLALAGELNETIHILALTWQIEVEEMALQPAAGGDPLAWRFTCRTRQPLKELQACFWPAWRPWAPPYILALEPDEQGTTTFTTPALTPGRYLVELQIADPWIGAGQPAQRPVVGAPGVYQVDTHPPPECLVFLEAQIQAMPNPFRAYFERAVLLADLGDLNESQEALAWCVQNSDQADLPDILVLLTWLRQIRAGALEQELKLKMFVPARLRLLLKARQNGQLSDDQYQVYLQAAPPPAQLAAAVARLLLEANEETVVPLALQALMYQDPGQGVEEVLDRVKERRLSERDAVGLLALNGRVSIQLLQEKTADLIAVRLLEGLIPEFGDQVPVVRPGTWINCGVGWGQIQYISDPQTGESIAHYIQGSKQPVLRIRLRAGEQQGSESIEANLATKTAKFAGVAKIWTCSKCRRFTTGIKHDLISEQHDPAVHGGIGPSFEPQKSVECRITGPIQYRTQRPRNIWQ